GLWSPRQPAQRQECKCRLDRRNSVLPPGIIPTPLRRKSRWSRGFSQGNGGGTPMRRMIVALIVVELIELLCVHVLADSQVLSLDDAIKAAENNNRTIRIAQLERK